MKHIFALILLFVLSPLAHAGTNVVNWTQDTSVCADGSPAASNCPLVGFQISEGTSVETLKPKENLAPTARSVTYQNIAAGTTSCYSLKSFTGTTTAPILSGESNRACTTMPFVPPKAPAGLSVTVNITITAAPPAQ